MAKRNRNLKELDVLAIDCQATHSNPRRGHILEVGWVETRAAEAADFEEISNKTETFLLKIPKHAEVPRPVLRITGLSHEEMKSAQPPKTVWEYLSRAAENVAHKVDRVDRDRTIRNKSTRNFELYDRDACPAIIHFSRYEEPFLRKLHINYSPNEEFPFSIVCTHKIAERLLPGLPRKGLRAVAGYFGHPLPDSRRSRHHVVATAITWFHLVELLRDAHAIDTFDDLREWLRQSRPQLFHLRKTREYPMAETYRENLPDLPGVYRMYRSGGDLLYIGKAKSLRQRIASYFHRGKRHPEHILEMLSQAQSLDTTVARTAVEAALVESDEIKRLSPPYNRALRTNERDVLFYSRDLTSVDLRPDPHHSIGPLPSSYGLDPLILLRDVLGGDLRKISLKTIEGILDIPPEYLPNRDCFISGIQAFKKEFQISFQPSFGLTAMMLLGAQFWKDKLEEQDAAAQREVAEKMAGENDAPESAAKVRASGGDRVRQTEEEFLELRMQESEPEESEETWMPERVVRILKSIIRMAAFQIRRSRWLCRISESSLMWTPATGNIDVRNWIVFEEGIPVFKDSLSFFEIHSIPSGHQRSLIERQKNFNIYVFDRMRVATTEIRRLIQEGRSVELCLHPDVCLRNEQLKKMLRWV
ncbi:MAG: hypothetical protein PVH84_05455 [Candidatus Aminicenantes bacterium]|jgi:DNA polymerase III epsilon subunit-like protein